MCFLPVLCLLPGASCPVPGALCVMLLADTRNAWVRCHSAFGRLLAKENLTCINKAWLAKNWDVPWPCTSPFVNMCQVDVLLMRSAVVNGIVRGFRGPAFSRR